MITETRRAELRRLAGLATPGPWTYRPGESWVVRAHLPNTPAMFFDRGVIPGSEDLSARDASYLAAISPDVLIGLLDELDRFDACDFSGVEAQNQIDVLEQDLKAAEAKAAALEGELNESRQYIKHVLAHAIKKMDEEEAALRGGTP